jgi:23S rRNA (cytosine1962-C5)-methyltransferase
MTTYQLLDSGAGRKLEQVGDYVIIRPCPQALWEPFAPELWESAQSEFVKEKGERGVWRARNLPEGVKKKQVGSGIPDSWVIVSPTDVRYHIEPNDFGNIGVFPEHWLYSADISSLLPRKAQVLNVFTYTGSNALDLVKEFHEVTVVDSAKTAMNTYTHNLDANRYNRKGQRLVLEDASKFLDREIRRGKQYDCVMIDAPSYGRGTKNEIFDLEKKLLQLFESASKLCKNSGHVIFTLHSPRYTHAGLNQTLTQIFPNRELSIQELLLPAKSGSYLPSGTLIQISPTKK